MKYCSTLTRLRRHYLTDKRDYSVVETLPGMPEMASVWLDPPYTIDILHPSCNIWLIRFGMAT